MKIDRIIMVEPRTPANHVYSRFAIPRLGLPILGGLAVKMGIETKVVIEEMGPFDREELDRYDLLCISTITPTAKAAYALADHARERGLPVLLGGPHATYLPDEAMRHADWVLRGEAEVTFPMLLDALREDGDLSKIPGLSYRDGRAIVHVEADRCKVALDEIPQPNFDIVAGLENGQFPRGVIPIMTSRGCPHHCSFCSVTPMFGHKMRYASKERVADEILRLKDRGEMIFFVDDNFCASPKRTKELLRYLLVRGIEMPPWLAQVSVRAARDTEMLELMRRAGCHTVFVGFESINPKSLSLLRKGQAVDDIRRAIRRFHEHGIGVHGMFVFGTDEDDKSTIRATARFAIEEEIESVQFLVLTPLPGTPFYQEMKNSGRLLTTDWSLYDAHHAVFQTKNMSPYEVMNESFKAMARVYSLRRTLHLLRTRGVQRAAISVYSAGQVRRWFKQNRALLRQLKSVDRQRRRSSKGYPVPQLRQAFASVGGF